MILLFFPSQDVDITPMATECTPLTNTDDITPVSGSEYISLSKHETDHTPPCLKPRCCVYAALL